MSQYETVIGLEIHAELLTRSKIFCACPTHFGAAPNSQVCPICLGLPGALPVLNRQAVEFAIQAGLALGCEIAGHSKFDRKNYFYPDLPKAYQISQYDLPLCQDGRVEFDADGERRSVGIVRVHLEEEAGKSIHSAERIIGSEYSLIDYNRTGIPLIEIVTQPDLRSPAEARQFLEHLKMILQYIGVSDCKMEEGSLRCDANVSIRPRGATALGVKTEVKNLNSFRAVQRALEHEAQRQAAVLETGGRVRQETRHWNEVEGVTIAMRTKEEADDYRYFPEPDLVPLEIGRDWTERLRRALPELPAARKNRFAAEYQLPAYDAGVLTAARPLADFFEAAVRAYPQPKVVSNWVMGELLRLLKETGTEPEEIPIAPEALGELSRLVETGRISGAQAKEVFEAMFRTRRSPGDIVAARGMAQISDQAALAAVIESVVAENPGPVADVRGGKEKAIGFLVGQVMKKTQGKANPKVVGDLLRARLSSGAGGEGPA